jgi:hypothetical protein
MTEHHSHKVAHIHHELHSHLPSDPALRVKALESLLIEKNLVDPNTVDAWIGKPTDYAFIEAFNSKVRSECLNAHWFMSLDDARSKLEDWRRYHNEERPQSGIGQIVPILTHKPGGASSPSPANEAENSGLR